MHVANPTIDSPPREDAASTLAAALCESPSMIPLIVGAIGMGKTTVLGSGVRQAARKLGVPVHFIPGEVVASEGHLASLLRDQLSVRGHTATAQLHVEVDDALGALASTSPAILAIDDLDVLFFKRQRIAKAITHALRSTSLRLAGSVGTDALERIIGRERPLTHTPNRFVRMIRLGTLSTAAAKRLALRRNSALSRGHVERIACLAGGHPAAVVFLSRLMRLAPAKGPSTNESGFAVLSNAGEFAAAVYSEPWASLGPQQRAIIAQLGSLDRPASAGELAESLSLSPSHISAQLTRLRAEGLVTQVRRGRFAVAPLLAKWLAHRVFRINITATSERGATESDLRGSR